MKHNNYGPHFARSNPGMAHANAEYTLKALLALMDSLNEDGLGLSWPEDLTPPPGWVRDEDPARINKEQES